jgi:hypothetical protein
MANLPLAFAELLGGAILLDAAVKGDTIANVVKGVAQPQPLPGSSAAAALAAGATGTGASSGGTTGTLPAGSIPAGSYTNPVPGAKTGRIDQGVDYALGPAGFVAPGASKIVYIASGTGLSGWGNEYVAGQLLDGPLKGAIWYIAEAGSITKGIVQGATVQAGQQITPQGSSTGGAIEAGWADPSNPGNPLARSLSGYSGDQSIGALTAGYSFSAFVHSLGGLAGVFQGAGQALSSTIQAEFATHHAAGVPYEGP